jgi:hypothetical protein
MLCSPPPVESRITSGEVPLQGCAALYILGTYTGLKS